MSDYLNFLNDNFPIRRTKKEKESFRNYIVKELENSAYTAYIEEFKKSKNVVIGDIQNAEVIFTAHYDTPCTSIIPNLMIPQNFCLSFLYQSVLWSIVFIIEGVISILIATLIIDNETTLEYFLLELLIFWIIYIALFILSFRCFKNKHNKNDNTSGVSVIMSLTQKCTSEKVAFILFDNEEKGLLGSKGFNKKYKDLLKSKLVVNFDCVGVGNNILFVAKKTAENHNLYGKLKEFNKSDDNYNVLFFSGKNAKLNSDNKVFECSVGVCACKNKAGIYYAGKIHTNRDKEACTENIDFIANNMLGFIDDIS